LDVSYNLLKLLNNAKYGSRRNKGKSIFSKIFDNKIALSENNVPIRNKWRENHASFRRVDL